MILDNLDNYMKFIYLHSSVIHHLDGLFEPNILTSSQMAC